MLLKLSGEVTEANEQHVVDNKHVQVRLSQLENQLASLRKLINKLADANKDMMKHADKAGGNPIASKVISDLEAEIRRLRAELEYFKTETDKK